MSWFLAFAGFASLIILHELGHFAAAKAVGMRVERFSLFFGRTPLRWQRGETEYGIGWLPLGGRLPIIQAPPQHFTGFYTVDSLIAGDFATFWLVLQYLLMPAVALAGVPSSRDATL